MSQWARLGGVMWGLVILLAPMAAMAAEAPAAGGPVLDLPTT